MELSPALKAKVEKAIHAALKDAKPRPAVDRLVAARITGKWAHYCQFLTEYGPGEFGCIYVSLPELNVKIHEAGSKGAKRVARMETKRRARQERVEARKAKAANRTAASKEKAAAKPFVTPGPKARARKSGFTDAEIIKVQKSEQCGRSTAIKLLTQRKAIAVKA